MWPLIFFVRKSEVCYVLANSKSIFVCEYSGIRMTPFLKQVADHYFNCGDIQEICFIFPNRRSMVFYKKYLSEVVASASDKPVIMPGLMTMSDFFGRVSSDNIADRVTLLVTLYECYSALNPKAESLDEFIFWGDIILGDFNDVDKYLADPKQLFANVADYKNLQDTFEYLTDNQRKAIEAFARHFVEKTSRKTDNPKAQDVSRLFLHIWNLMYPLYLKFNEVLKERGLAYEGMVYRSLAQKASSSIIEEILADVYDCRSYVFVGLNALNECEKVVMRRMRDAGIAEFCWDYSGEMITHELNKSSFFMSQNMKEFKPAFDIDAEGLGLPSFNVLSVPSSYGQVKHISGIFSRLGVSDCPSDCAVVLPDEGLLMPLLNSIPPEIGDINVTMGYPMSASELWALMGDVMKMQIHIRRKGDECRFYHKHVWNVLSNALFRKLMEGDQMQACREKVARIKQEAKYYISQSDLSGFPLFDVVFQPVVHDMSLADSRQINAMAEYQQQVLAFIAPELSANMDVALEVDFAKEYWCAVNRLKAMNLSILPVTYVRLLDSLLSCVSVPFSGEPLKGLQIMGPLETRALDFKNVIILSCNEGVFPRRTVSSSFVPPELRRGFGLPTYEYQDAVWAYYFYRLISRAENVWMLYDSRTEGLKNGEESRYIKQLRYHFRIPVNTYVSDAEPGLPTEEGHIVRKTPQVLEAISSCWLSPSALQNYIDCPMRFYYYSVLKLKKDKEVAESMDPAMIGNVYHNVMWALFTSEAEMMSDRVFDKREDKPQPMANVTKDYLESWLKREDDIRRKVESLMCEELGTDEIVGRNLVTVSVIVRYVKETIRRDIELLGFNGADCFEIVGLEKPLDATLYGLKFYGVADRIDRIGGKGNVRMVDYKSGKDDPVVLATDDAHAEGVAEVIFGGDHDKRKKFKAGLQFFIYDKMLQENGIADLKHVSNTMYATAGLFAEVPGVCQLNQRFAQEMECRLERLLKEIQDPQVPFTKTEDEANCEWCDFRMICGR